MDLILKFIYNFKNSSRRLFSAIFYKPGQWFVIILGTFIIIIGCKIDSELLSPIVIAIGGSVFASGLVVKILSRIPRDAEEERLVQTGIIFIGDRDSFDKEYHVGNQKGWDAWIRQTPRGGHLIIIGKEHRFWIQKSWADISSVLKKGIETNFVFLGNETQVIKSHISFTNNLENSPVQLKCWKYVPDGSHEDVDDFGFYWNGRVLLVKMYLHNIDKEYCPIIGFKIPGTVGTKFNIEDFHEPATLILSHAKALVKCAESLNHIWTIKQSFNS